MKANQQIKGKPIKKNWYSVVATSHFNSAILGESYVSEPDMLIDRHLSINLANLSGDIKQQGVNLKFKVTSVKDERGVADVIGYQASSAQLRRLVRRGVERFDDSFICTTSDGAKVRIKPYAVTRSSASKTKVSQMRLSLRQMLQKEVLKSTYAELVQLAISHKLQMSLKNALKKLTPLRAIEIRRMEIISFDENQKDVPVAQLESEPNAKEDASTETISK